MSIRDTWDLTNDVFAGDSEHLLEVALRDPDRRHAALSMLGDLGDPETAPGITRLLGAGDATTRRLAAKALGDIGSPSATEPLLERLVEETDPAVRAMVVEALGRIGDPTAASAIRGILDEPDDRLHREAAIASARICDYEALPALRRALEHLASRDPRRDVLERAAADIESGRGWSGDRPSAARRALSFVAWATASASLPVRLVSNGLVVVAIYVVARQWLPAWAWVSLLAGWFAFLFAAGTWRRIAEARSRNRARA